MNNSAEFEEVFKLYKDKINRYLARMIDEGESDDLTQEVFIKVSKSLPELKDRSSISSWIYRIATNTAIDRMRSPSYRHSAGTIPEELLVAEDQSIWTGNRVLSTDQQVIEKEMNDCIRNFINNLPENYRTVLLLSELENFKNKEIADILGITLDTVKIRLHRARGLLRKELEAGCDFYENPQARFS
jgi:RNA polymerase sigma-70 factor, ECF subfamily